MPATESPGLCRSCPAPAATRVPTETFDGTPGEPIPMCWLCAHRVCEHGSLHPCDCPRDQIYPPDDDNDDGEN